jgi:hypothetical protein
MKSTYGLPISCFEELRCDLALESDRGRLLLAGICIELFLKAKFLNEGLKPASLFEMLKQARTASWIEEDVFHDAEIIRKLRNRCAHEGGRVELDADDIRMALQQVQVPHRRYHDWARLRAASTAKGFVLYSGERPDSADEDLRVPAAMTFNVAIWTILHVLAANLEIPFATEAPNEVVILELPSFMRLAS